MNTNPISIVEAVVFLAIMLAVVKFVVDALEGIPGAGFNSPADDYIEDGWDEATDVWDEVSG